MGSIDIFDGVELEEAVPEIVLTGIDRIIDMMEDPDTHIADISRLIALEIANVVKLMSSKVNPKGGMRDDIILMKDLNDHVKALLALQKTLTESDSLSRKDTLNLDGPKFKYVFQAIMGLFGLALKDAGIDEQHRANVMLQFGDLIKSHDETFRRELNKIEVGR